MNYYEFIYVSVAKDRIPFDKKDSSFSVHVYSTIIEFLFIVYNFLIEYSGLFFCYTTTFFKKNSIHYIIADVTLKKHV